MVSRPGLSRPGLFVCHRSGPAAEVEKPHCGLTASLSIDAYCAAPRTRASNSLIVLPPMPVLVITRSSTTPYLTGSDADTMWVGATRAAFYRFLFAAVGVSRRCRRGLSGPRPASTAWHEGRRRRCYARWNTVVISIIHRVPIRNVCGRVA
jgi:hypothetical protein